MEIKYKGYLLKKAEDWHNYIYVGKKAKDWKVGKSAESLANFICNHDGISELEKVISQIVGLEVLIDDAHPEHEVRFDKYGHGREHDMAIIAHSGDKTVFIGLEAKVNEEMGPTIVDAYTEFKAKELRGEATNGCKRIDALMEKYLPVPIKKSDFALHYQLLHATAGTLAAESASKKNFDYYVFLVVTFVTQSSNDDCAKRNHRCFEKYCKRILAEPTKGTKDTFKTIADGKTLYLAYREINLQ